MQDRILDQSSDDRLLEPAGPETAIETVVGLAQAVRLLGEALRDGSRQAVDQTKCHELDRFSRVEMRQVTAGMPTLVRHASFLFLLDRSLACMSARDARGPEDHALPDRRRPARLMIMSAPDARGPEEHETR